MCPQIFRRFSSDFSESFASRLDYLREILRSHWSLHVSPLSCIALSGSRHSMGLIFWQTWHWTLVVGIETNQESWDEPMTLGEYSSQLVGRTQLESPHTPHVRSMDLFEHRVPLDPLIDHYVSYLEWPFGGLPQICLCIGILNRWRLA